MAGSFRSPAKVARRIGLTPLVSSKVENWPSFMYHYAMGLVPGAPYRFRSGASLQIGRGVDHVPIIEIFLREDYGEIPNDAVILDIGANIGTFSIYAAMSARNVRLYSCEPMADFFRLLQANVRLNGLTEVVRCLNCAVGAADSERELFVPGRDLLFPTLVQPEHGETTSTTTVRCTTLMSLLEANAIDRVDLMKMDVEGAEYEILYGASSACFDRIAAIRMEYHDVDRDQRNVHRLKEFLMAQRYRITREQKNTSTNGNLWVEKS